MMTKITPFLWFAKGADEAAAFYASIFPDSRVTRTSSMESETPSGPPGSVKVVEFTLLGQPFMAMTAGKMDDFNHAISFMVPCKDQAEIDRYWNALQQGGGKEEECGWVRDRWGVAWQIVPAELQDMTADRDREKARRTEQAMLKMKKLDIAKLRAAYDGR